MAGGPVTLGTTVRAGTVCLTGTIRRAEPIGFIQRGTHRLIGTAGNVLAALQSDTVNLFGLEGRFVTVCGVDEGVIEGVRSIRVTSVFVATTPQPPQPAPTQIDIRTLLLLLLLTQPQIFQTRPELLLLLFLSGGLGTSGLAGLGTGVSGIGGLGIPSLGGFGTPGLGAFGVPGFGTPGLGAFGAPGFGTPGLGAFGTPGFGTPGLGAFGTPGFGTVPTGTVTGI